MGSRSTRGRNATRSSRPSGALTWRAYRRPGRRSPAAMHAAETTWANTESASSPTTRPRSSRGRRRNARCSRGGRRFARGESRHIPPAHQARERYAADFDPRRGTTSLPGLHPGRVSDASSALSEVPDSDCRLMLSINTHNTQLCFRLCAWDETSGEPWLTAHLDLVVGAAAPVADGVP